MLIGLDPQTVTRHVVSKISYYLDFLVYHLGSFWDSALIENISLDFCFGAEILCLIEVDGN